MLSGESESSSFSEIKCLHAHLKKCQSCHVVSTDMLVTTPGVEGEERKRQDPCLLQQGCVEVLYVSIYSGASKKPNQWNLLRTYPTNIKCKMYGNLFFFFPSAPLAIWKQQSITFHMQAPGKLYILYNCTVLHLWEINLCLLKEKLTPLYASREVASATNKSCSSTTSRTALD